MERAPSNINKQGSFKLYVTIPEGCLLQSCDADDDAEALISIRPKSPRNRSRSMIEGTRGSFGVEFEDLDSTGPCDGVSNFESLPKFYRSLRRAGRLNTQLLDAVKCCNALEVQRLLKAGASPNATCHTECISACHIAALFNNDIFSILLEHGAERTRTDRLGRTPLHLAAWSGNVRHIVALLNFPEDLQQKLNREEMTSETEEEIKRLSNGLDLQNSVNVRCVLGDLNMVTPKEWRDNIDHSCKEIDLPFLQPGWTPLHAAACSARHQCCRVLLAAGAEPSIRDCVGRTPLDVAGSACLYGQHTKQPCGSTLINFGFTEVIKMLLTKSDKRDCGKKGIMQDTPLHTAVELENLEVINLLLKAGFSSRSWNRAGLTPLHLCVKKRLKQHLQAFIDFNPSDGQVRRSSVVNARDRDDYTVLHFAVLNNWAAGVCIALEARADLVLPAKNSETPLHTAAALGNLDILKAILSYAKTANVIDVLNIRGETPLFKAIMNDHVDCVKMLLKEGASIEHTLPKQYNVFHIAAERGQLNMLKILLDYKYTFTREKVNIVTLDDRIGYGPIHFAVKKNHIECVKLLLSQNAFVSLKTKDKGSTPLHIAARLNNLEIAKIIIKFDSSTVHSVDAMGWTPLHTAAYYASRDTIRLLINEGANLAACTIGPATFQRTAIELIINGLSKSTEFLESLFDMSIHTHRNENNELGIQDPDTHVKVDYSVLVPKSPITEGPDNKLTVIEALLKTGNRCGQKRLLIHPLVESFLCLKWQALLPFFYTMLFLYGLFVVTLTSFIMTEYFYRDTNFTSNFTSNLTICSDSNVDMPFGMNTKFWTYALYATTAVIVLQEIIFLSTSVKMYLLQLETWVKLTSILLAIILPTVMQICQSPPVGTIDWQRHIATMAILLCWLDMTFLLSRFPNWGYYVLMFGKVSSNVLKILLTFAFLVIGFALSFMIQFHHQTPFESPWAALVKTMVMMTSEFDYDDLVDKKDQATNLIQSLLVIRLVFLLFLILAAIVLMNLMVGVAVHDLHNLEVLGHIMRLEKQVDFLASLETLVLNKVFLKLLPAKWKYHLEISNELRFIVLKPCEPSWSYSKTIPAHVRETIFEKAIAQMKHETHQFGYETLRKQLSEIHETVKELKVEEFPRIPSISKTVSYPKQLPQRLTDTDMMVVRMKRQIDDMNTKLDFLMKHSLRERPEE